MKLKSPLKRTSAKKKTPGKRKTPRSAKRQLVVLSHPETSRESTKRALFTSSAEKSSKTSVLTSDTLACGKLPRRTLFSPDGHQKRKRSTSPDQDAENREEKRAKLSKSQSFSVAPNPSGSMIPSYVNKRLFRTQSEMNAQESRSGTRLGYKDPMTDVVKKVR